VLPNTANIRDLGSASQRWRTAYVQSADTINLTITGTAVLPNPAFLTIPGGSNGYVLQTDGTGNLSWVAQSGGGNGVPGGANTQIQFNDAGSFGGDVDLTYNKSTNTLNLNGTLTALDATVYGTVAAVSMTASGNVAASYFVGNGSQLTGISSSAGGSNTQIQFNDGGVLGGNSQFTYNQATGNLNVNGFEIGNQTITGTLANANITIHPDGSGALFIQGSGNALVHVQGDLPNFQNRIRIENYGNIGIGGGGEFQGQWTRGTPGAPEPAQIDDKLAQFGGRSWDGNTYGRSSGWISIDAADNWTPSNRGTHISFHVTAPGEVEPAEQMRLGANGNLILYNGNLAVLNGQSRFLNTINTHDILPTANAVYSLGNSSLYWSNLWVANNTIYIGGVPLGMSAGNVLTVGGNAVLTNGSNTTISTTGNVTANVLIATDFMMANGIFGDDTIVMGNGSGAIQAYAQASGFGIQTYDGATYHTWTFDNSGNLNLPSEGNIVGSTPNNYGYLQWVGNSSGDGGGYTTLRLVPDDTVEAGDQYLIIDPTGGGHIHIRAGGTQDNSAGELFLGGEKNFVRVVDNSGVRVQNEQTVQQTNNYYDPADFTNGQWYTMAGLYYIEYTSTNAQLDVDPYLDINYIYVTYDGGANNATLTYASSTQNLGGGTYRVRVNEVPPAEPTVLAQISYTLNVTTTNYLQLEYNNLQAYVDNSATIQANAGIQLTSQNSTDSIRITTDNLDDSWTWDFGANGVMTAPGSISASSITLSGNVTANYFIGDGSQLTNLPGGGGNTGNVTFNNQIIIGTGDQGGGGGLYLAPGVDSPGNLQYFRVRGGDFVTHIHLDTGNNAFFDQYFGDDNKYVKLEATGAIVVNSNDGIGNTAQWAFGTDGNLILPGNTSQINYANGTSVLADYATISSNYSSNATTQSINNPDGGGTYNNSSTLDITYTAYTGASTLNFDIAYQAPLTANIGVTVSAVSTPLIQSNANIQIQANTGTAQTWTFDTAGDMSAPGNITAPYIYGNTTEANVFVGGTANILGNVTAGNILTTGSGGDITMTGGDILGVNIVVTTPTALANLTAVSGGRAFVNDGNLAASGNFGNLIGSGGSNVVPVWSDGSNWYIG